MEKLGIFEAYEGNGPSVGKIRPPPVVFGRRLKVVKYLEMLAHRCLIMLSVLYQPVSSMVKRLPMVQSLALGEESERLVGLGMLASARLVMLS